MKVTFQAHNSRVKGNCSKIKEKGVAHRGRKILSRDTEGKNIFLVAHKGFALEKYSISHDFLYFNRSSTLQCKAAG
jgi:hypothetical protein